MLRSKLGFNPSTKSIEQLIVVRVCSAPVECAHLVDHHLAQRVRTVEQHVLPLVMGIALWAVLTVLLHVAELDEASATAP